MARIHAVPDGVGDLLVWLACDPGTDADTLAWLAAEHPQLRPLTERHPSTCTLLIDDASEATPA